MPEIAFFNQKLGTFEKRFVKELKDMQNLVEGLIEPVQITDNLDFVFNEEGLIRGMEPSIIDMSNNTKYVGPFFVARLGSNGKYINLRPKDWKFLKKLKIVSVITNKSVTHVVKLEDDYLPSW